MSSDDRKKLKLGRRPSRVVGKGEDATTGPVPFPELGAEAMGRAAQRALAEMTERHQAELEKTRRESYEAGRRSGREEGKSASKAELSQAVETFRSLLHDLESQRSVILRDAETRVVELAVRVAGRILDREVQVDRAAVVGVVRGALRLVEENEPVVLRVHPDDLPLVEKHMAEEKGGGRPALRAVASDSVPRGGCVVEAGGHDVDARIESQLEEIRSALTTAAAAEPTAEGEGDSADHDDHLEEAA